MRQINLKFVIKSPKQKVNLTNSLIIIGLLITIFFTYATLTQANQQEFTTAITLSPQISTIFYNETFTIDILISAETLYTAQCWIVFDSSLIEVVKIEAGDIFASIKGPKFQVDNINGTIDDISGFQLSPIQFGGTLATITFSAKEMVGTANIELLQDKCIVDDYNVGILNNAQVHLHYPIYLDINPSYELINNTTEHTLYLDPTDNAITTLRCNITYNSDLFDVTIIHGTLFDDVTTEETIPGIIEITAIKSNPYVTNAGVILKLELNPIQTGKSDIMITNAEISNVSGVFLSSRIHNASLEADISPPLVELISITPSALVNNTTYVDIPSTLTVDIFEHNLIKVSMAIIDNNSNIIPYMIEYTYENSSNKTMNTYSEKWDTFYGLSNGTITEEKITIKQVIANEFGNYLTIEGLYNETGDQPNIPVIAFFDINTYELEAFYPSTLEILYGVSKFCPQTILYTQDENIFERINTTTIFVLTENFTLTLLTPTEKTYKIYVNAEDIFNQKGDDTKTVTLDISPPITNANLEGTLGDNGWFVNNINLTLISLDINGSGIDTIYYRIGDNDWQTYSEVISIDTDGIYTLLYYAIDSIGNNETLHNLTIKSDTLIPTVQIQMETIPVLGNENLYNVDLTLIATDNTSGISTTMYRINYGEWITYYGTFTVSDVGYHNIDYYASDNAGNTGIIKTISFEVLGNQKPIAMFTYIPTNPIIFETISFNDQSTDDGTIVLWAWNFNDGTIEYGKTVTHAFSDIGRYHVTLTVADDGGASDTCTIDVIVSKINENEPPSKPIITGPSTGHSYTEYSFSALSYDPDNDEIQYIFDWGDGETSKTDFIQTGISTIQTHEWIHYGKYFIKVKAYDGTDETEISNCTILIDILLIDDKIKGYLIDLDGDNTYDVFDNFYTGNQTETEDEQSTYLIDIDGNETWDYAYSQNTGVLTYYEYLYQKYYTKISQDTPGFELIALIAVMILVFIFINKKKSI